MEISRGYHRALCGNAYRPPLVSAHVCARVCVPVSLVLLLFTERQVDMIHLPRLYRLWLPGSAHPPFTLPLHPTYLDHNNQAAMLCVGPPAKYDWLK